MRSIQEVGLEILSGSPAKFYVFTGVEYGIKITYINKLKEHYGGNYVAYDSVDAVLELMHKKHLIPLKPSVYVVRYDESFISSLNQTTSNYIKNTKVVGTIVVIYEDDKSTKKLDKYLPNYTVEIAKVSDNIVEKYLHSDFSGIPDRFVKLAIKCSSDYNQARNICQAMKCANTDDLYQLDDDRILKLFGYTDGSTDDMLKSGIAAKNFNYCLSVLEQYSEYDTIYYTILQTLVELEKQKVSKFVSSELGKYAKLWTLEDIYYMFDNTYKCLIRSRSAQIDIKSDIIILLSLLSFKSIPSMEV